MNIEISPAYSGSSTMNASYKGNNRLQGYGIFVQPTSFLASWSTLFILTGCDLDRIWVQITPGHVVNFVQVTGREYCWASW
jgi:hypothetical protein